MEIKTNINKLLRRKDFISLSGIYSIVDNENNVLYIGKTNSLYTRNKRHKNDIELKREYPSLQNELNKLDTSNIFFKILEVFKPYSNLSSEEDNELIRLENKYIQEYKPIGNLCTNLLNDKYKK